jgi:tetratricopeptide (TPR) repeat protein
MESILNNLQQIKDLRVISRTSVEKYRNNSRTIPELARELNVNYFVEGSGQKIGDQILLHIQLIEAESDEHLSSKQYRKETKDIFQLQIEVARDIAGEIEAIITPEEATRINKTPTENVEAYDYFLKGLDLFYKGSPDDLREAIALYKQAIELDGEFARAYAGIAIAYFTLDANQIEKVYSEQINHYADQALLFDPQLPQSLIAKALFYMYHDENELALPYLEKALEYNPNSALVINILADFYTTKMPNTAKYLEYALKGVELDIAAHDSITASFIYLHLSNAFVQAGFVKEAKKYINKSLESYPENIYSTYVKAYVQYAQNEDLELLKESLVETLKKDTTRLDVLQEVGKAYYFLRDYESAYAYYKKFLDIKRALKLDIYPSEDIKMALVFSEKEMNAESEILLKQYKSYIENDKSIYKHLGLSAYYSYTGDLESSIEHMKLFSKEDDFFYWLIVFMDADPTMDNVKNLPAFKKIMKQVEKKFWNNHKEIRAALESKNLL